jgi:hypothetical protein
MGEWPERIALEDGIGKPHRFTYLDLLALLARVDAALLPPMEGDLIVEFALSGEGENDILVPIVRTSNGLAIALPEIVVKGEIDLDARGRLGFIISDIRRSDAESQIAKLRTVEYEEAVAELADLRRSPRSSASSAPESSGSPPAAPAAAQPIASSNTVARQLSPAAKKLLRKYSHGRPDITVDKMAEAIGYSKPVTERALHALGWTRKK